MFLVLFKTFLTFAFIISQSEELKNSDKFLISKTTAGEYFDEMQLLLTEILYRTKVDHCFAIISDNDHEHVFDGSFFKKPSQLKGNFFATILNSEDMLSPNYRTVKILQQIKATNCDLVFLLVFNGIQVKRFLIFLDEHRILNTSSKFVLLYDRRIFVTNLNYIWKKIVSVVFIQRVEKEKTEVKFNLVTVPFPHVLRRTSVIKKISEWRNGKLTNRKGIFSPKTDNLEGTTLKTVVQEHIPMVMKRTVNSFMGLEIEILNALAKVMNFTVEFYESLDSETEFWGRRLLNGTYTGLIGEMVNGQADIAVGDLHMTEFYLDIMDLTIPHSRECLTFLTPESTADNSWKTLILPLNGDMWAGVLISLLFVGTVFYIISRLHTNNIRRPLDCNRLTVNIKAIPKSKGKMPRTSNSISSQPPQDIFDEFSSCILLTYSMLLLVSLPKMPKNWPLRMLTGWYWIYCILVAAIYRSSFTAILANPSPRITIDTLAELAKSSIIVGAWGEKNKNFFLEAFDENAQKIGEKLEEMQDINGTLERIISGQFAYYDNEYFLRSLRLQGRSNMEGEEVLHIMKECVISMPVSIGLEKNSPLKQNVDKYIQRLIEGGFIHKWLKDFTSNLPAEEEAPQEALINLKKFWSSFVALGFGYILGFFALISERYHFKYVVLRHPLYDPYNERVYYEFIKHKGNR